MSATPTTAVAHTAMTHKQKRERRKAMAEAVHTNGRSFAEVAQIFEVSLRTVEYACKEFPKAAAKPATPADRKRRKSAA